MSADVLAGLGPFPQFTAGGVRYPALVGWYWVLTIVGGFWQPLFTTLLIEINPDYLGPVSTPAVNLPVLFGGAALATTAGLWARRRSGLARAAGAFLRYHGEEGMR